MIKFLKTRHGKWLVSIEYRGEKNMTFDRLEDAMSYFEKAVRDLYA